MKTKIFNFLSNITTACKIWSKKTILSYYSIFILFYYFFFFWKIEKIEYQSSKFHFHLPSNSVGIDSRKNSKDIDVFSVNQLDNNDKSGNKESAVCYLCAICWHITFNGICLSTKDLLNWIALSIKLLQRE